MRFFGLLSFRQIAPFGGGWGKELDDPSHGVWGTCDISGNGGEKERKLGVIIKQERKNDVGSARSLGRICDAGRYPVADVQS
jgi:hypothetical protein